MPLDQRQSGRPRMVPSAPRSRTTRERPRDAEFDYGLEVVLDGLLLRLPC